MQVTPQQAKAISEQMRRYAVKQYVINLRRFRESLAQTLATNPHNTWKGTVSQYMIKYNIKKGLYKAALKQYSIN